MPSPECGSQICFALIRLSTSNHQSAVNSRDAPNRPAASSGSAAAAAVGCAACGAGAGDDASSPSASGASASSSASVCAAMAAAPRKTFSLCFGQSGSAAAGCSPVDTLWHPWEWLTCCRAAFVDGRRWTSTFNASIECGSLPDDQHCAGLHSAAVQKLTGRDCLGDVGNVGCRDEHRVNGVHLNRIGQYIRSEVK